MKRRRVPCRAVCVLAAVTLILSVSTCNRSEPEQQGQDSANTESTQEDAAPSNAIQLDMNGSQNSEEPGKPPSGSSSFGPVGFTLPAGELTSVAPRDFVVGELAHTGPARTSADGGSRAMVAAAVREFFLEDTLESSRLEPSSRRRLTRSLAGRWRASTEVRVAVPDHLADGRWRVKLRLLSARGEAIGEVYVEEHAGTWYIADVAVPMTQLDEPRQERSFEPGQPPTTGGL